MKTKIGHLEAARRIAGFIKAALAVQHATIPPICISRNGIQRIDAAADADFVPARARHGGPPEG
ncbi:beta-ketoacyl synthase, C-terminal domain protein [Mycobacterium kansasii 662]|uniref:Beta-ketoacyl synthase, C-terminal domain protein n=1 Tax=Mycobacterium kansasii 662 TaxID=1299326 RepID=X7XPZ0_MYCKA|nr:beta-ketoacyl synthase, C-terminal domain protein [Mycobacterium kansasii 662]